jgi:hypothetical protein
VKNLVIIGVNENLLTNFKYKWHGRVKWKHLTLHSLFAGIPLEPLGLVMQTLFDIKAA